MNAIFLLIIGHNSAGKSTAARLMADRLSLTVVEFGETVKKCIAQDPSLPSDPSLAFMELKRRHGPNLLLSWAAQCSYQRGLVMVGVRDEESFIALTQAYPNLNTIAIVAGDKLRYSRDCAKHVAVPEPTLSVDQFRLRDCLHTSWGLLQLIQDANFKLDNSGSLRTLKQRVDTIARDIAITAGGPNDQR